MKKGFTLIEIMLVVIIIGVLASLVVPRLAGRVGRARGIAAKADVEANISSAVDLYEMDIGEYPKTLEDLVEEKTGVANWDGPYLRKLPKDPWGQSYYYKSPGEHNKDYDISSAGKDGIIGSEDDITNWE